MSLEIFDCEQGSSDWYAARMGIPTSSQFATVLAKGKDGGLSLTRKKYLYELAGEIITGEPAESYSNAHMERGKVMEAEARSLYAFLTDEKIERVGFIRNGRAGCSPDALVGSSGMLEIKTALPHILIGHILKGDFPPEHKAQTQGSLWKAEREWIDLAIYWPKIEPFIIRATRDEPYIKNLAGEVDRFNDELDTIVARVRRHGMEQAA